jgi:replication-associated recombination protein RarA
MMPATIHGLGALTCVSALQKAIRRGLEADAMAFAVELMHTSKAYHSMVCKRLQIISHEDIDTTAQPWIVPFVHTACAQAQEWYKPENPGASRMALGNAIRLMCRAKKSREGDHFQAAIGLRSLLEGFTPQFEDYVFDQHTIKGKEMGRGLDHFRSEGTKLLPAPEKTDAYEDEAYRLWHIKCAGGSKANPVKLPPDDPDSPRFFG